MTYKVCPHTYILYIYILNEGFGIRSRISIPLASVVHKVCVKQSASVELYRRVPVAKHTLSAMLSKDPTFHSKQSHEMCYLPCLNKRTHFARLLPFVFKEKLKTVCYFCR